MQPHIGKNDMGIAMIEFCGTVVQSMCDLSLHAFPLLYVWLHILYRPGGEIVTENYDSSRNI